MIDLTETISTCGKCSGVSVHCSSCRRWFCEHLLKRFVAFRLCAECWPKEAK